MNYSYMEFKFDQGRVDRARKLQVVSVDAELEVLPDFHYMVVGIAKESVHYCHTKPHIDCDCEDFALGHDRLCKHLLAALLFEKEPIFMARMEGILAPATVRMVCGPPSAGKKLYVQSRAKRGDIIWDLDAIVSVLSLTTSAEAVKLASVMRKAFLLEIEEQIRTRTLAQNVWIIFSLSKAASRTSIAKRLGAEIIVIETSARDCRDYAMKLSGSEAGVRIFRDANRWWSRYDRCPTDTIVS